MSYLTHDVEAMLAQAGITINGPGPTDIHIPGDREQLFRRIFREGRLGLGESFMDGSWDVDDLTGFVTRLYEAHLGDMLKRARMLAQYVQALLSYRQTRARNLEVATVHYNKGNRLFECMLDRRWTLYSCGLYRNGARTIQEAQEAKCDLICRKLRLKPGDLVLDVGSGFTAGFLRFAVERYDVRGVGIVNSKEQRELSRERVQGLPIEIRLQDYRDIKGAYDHIVSIGMLEHVGWGHWRAYFKKMRDLLKGDGLMLVQWIASARATYACDPWLQKYIFPNGVPGSLGQITRAIEGSFICEDADNFGADYDRTLQAWWANLSENWPELEDTYGDMEEPTFRMMKYYLLGVAGTFRARRMQLYQLVLSKKGARGGYQPVR